MSYGDDIILVIRFSKFEAVIICFILISVAFFFALGNEKKTSTVSAQPESIKLPIIMYHHITTDKSKAGKYTVLVSEFEKDLEYIEQNGYTTVTVSDLISFVNGEVSLPEKSIMITFDDGFESFYSLAYPLLKEKNMKSVVSVIGKITEKYSEHEDHNINYSNLNFNQISELSSGGFVEIQNHSYDMHLSIQGQRKGISKLENETFEEYKKNLTNDLLTVQKILKHNCTITPQCVTYPYGAYSEETLPIIKKLGFKSTMLCEERINTIVPDDENSLYNLGRYNRPSGISTQEFFNKINES